MIPEGLGRKVPSHGYCVSISAASNHVLNSPFLHFSSLTSALWCHAKLNCKWTDVQTRIEMKAQIALTRQSRDHPLPAHFQLPHTSGKFTSQSLPCECASLLSRISPHNEQLSNLQQQVFKWKHSYVIRNKTRAYLFCNFLPFQSKQFISIRKYKSYSSEKKQRVPAQFLNSQKDTFLLLLNSDCSLTRV